MAKTVLGSSSTCAESPAGNTGGGDGGSKGATTFVQADSACFRDLVQRLTGPSVNETAQPVAAVKAPKKPTAELRERRKLYGRPNIEIARPATSFKVYQLPPAAYNHQVQSPSPPSNLQASPISSCSHPVALYPHPYCSWNKRVPEAPGELLEEKATKEKRSHLQHHSPRSKPRVDLEDIGACTVSAELPKLLTLFPLTSPTAADAKFPS